MYETIAALLLALTGVIMVLIDPGALRADTEPVPDGQVAYDTITVVNPDSFVSADSLAVADSLSVTPAVPDSQWAVHIIDLETLAQARALYDTLIAQYQPVFVRIRADWTLYRYQMFAGPWDSQLEADSAATALVGAGLAELTQVEGDTTGGVLAGLVLDPVRPLVPEPSAVEIDSASVVDDSPQAE